MSHDSLVTPLPRRHRRPRPGRGPAQFTEQLGVTWGPVLHLDAAEYRDGAGQDLVLPTTICYSVEAPHLELIQEVPGSVWVCNEHSNLHHIGFWSDDLPADSAGLAGVRVPAAALRPGRRRRPGVVRLPPQRASASASRSSTPAMREAMGSSCSSRDES